MDTFIDDSSENYSNNKQMTSARTNLIENSKTLSKTRMIGRIRATILAYTYFLKIFHEVKANPIQTSGSLTLVADYNEFIQYSQTRKISKGQNPNKN